MNIEKLSKQQPIEGFDLITSILLRNNNIDPEEFEKLFPDMFTDRISVNQFLKEYMQPLKETQKFIDFIRENYDKRICLITDYDVDGIFSTVILKMGLSFIGLNNVFYCIPKRIDSYGLSKALIDRAIEGGAEVIITADNGVGAKDATAYALEKGLKVLITDHHLPDENNIPEGVAIIDPKYNGDEFSGICGAYVAFKLVYALFDAFSDKVTTDYDKTEFMSELLVYAGVATISDLMPMLEENRLLVKTVMDYVNELKDRGMTDLRVMRILNAFGGRYILNDPAQLFNEETVAFNIAPCINSISRLGNSVEEVVGEIITCDNQSIYRNNYYAMNKERQRRTKIIAEKHVKNDDSVSIEVINPDDFPFEIAGLVGLMVNKITAEEHKPSLVGTRYSYEKDGETISKYSFSARSVLGYSIHDGVTRVKEAHPALNIAGGGHAQAMGLTFDAFVDENGRDSLDIFREAICADYLANKLDIEPTVYEMELDYVEYCVEAFDAFRFFGSGFNKIKFTYTGKLQYIEGQSLYVGDFRFISYSNTKQYKIGTNYEIVFNLNLAYKDGVFFTISEIHEVPETIA